MMEGRRGAVEWLREIAQRKCNCHEVVRMFGFACGESPCTECIPRLVGAIAQRVEKERALPDGVEWPRFEDGGLVNVGSEVELEGDTMLVFEVALDADGWALWCENDGLDGRLRGSYCKRVKRPAPKVLDADGVQIKVGDTVWATYNGCKHIVMAVCSDGSLHPEMVTDDGCMVEYEEGLWDFAKKVTHEQPDSWILWGEDLDMAVKAGEVDKVEMMRRAKALAKAASEAWGVE